MESLKTRGKRVLETWDEKKSDMLHRWEEKSRDFIHSFLLMFGKDGRLSNIWNEGRGRILKALSPPGSPRRGEEESGSSSSSGGSYGNRRVNAASSIFVNEEDSEDDDDEYQQPPSKIAKKMFTNGDNNVSAEAMNVHTSRVQKRDL